MLFVFPHPTLEPLKIRSDKGGVGFRSVHLPQTYGFEPRMGVQKIPLGRWGLVGGLVGGIRKRTLPTNNWTLATKK